MALTVAIERLSDGQADILQTFAQAIPTSVPSPDLISVSAFTLKDHTESVAAELNTGLVRLFHRFTCFDLPSRMVGNFRTDEVWLRNLDGNAANHIQPIPSDQIKESLENLCANWRDQYSSLKKDVDKLGAIAQFHSKFLIIHPFLDGNGRTARAILMQQCLDLFGQADMALMNKGAEYYKALKESDEGNFDYLVKVIEPIVNS